MAINLAEIAQSGRKLKELMLLIANLSSQDEQFGSIKLNKLLYYGDFEAYRKLEQPITCARYQHLDEGPAPMELLGAQEALVESGDAIIEERYSGGLLQRRIVPQREPDLSLFSKEELDIVRSVVSRFKEFNADQRATIQAHRKGRGLSRDCAGLVGQSACFCHGRRAARRGHHVLAAGACSCGNGCAADSGLRVVEHARTA